MKGIRVGKVSSIDYANGILTIVYPDQDNLAVEAPYLTFNNEYKMPNINDYVLVAHLSNGETAAICIGTYYCAATPPPESGKQLYRKDFGAGAFLKYDEKTGELLLSAKKIILKGEETHIF